MIKNVLSNIVFVVKSSELIFLSGHDKHNLTRSIKVKLHIDCKYWNKNVFAQG